MLYGPLGSFQAISCLLQLFKFWNLCLCAFYILRLDVGNAKVAISTRAGSREAIRNPITCAVASIFLKLHHILRRLEWLLLIPFNGVRTVLTTQGAREFCWGSQGERGWRWLSEHKLGERTWAMKNKEEEERSPGHNAGTTDLCWDRQVVVLSYPSKFSEKWEGPSCKFYWPNKSCFRCVCYQMSGCYLWPEVSQGTRVCPAAEHAQSWAVTKR